MSKCAGFKACRSSASSSHVAPLVHRTYRATEIENERQENVRGNCNLHHYMRRLCAHPHHYCLNIIVNSTGKKPLSGWIDEVLNRVFININYNLLARSYYTSFPFEFLLKRDKYIKRLLHLNI